MFISKKKYMELIKQKDDFERIATNAVAQNGRLLDEWKAAIEEIKDIHRFNSTLVDRNEELLAHVEELKAQLTLVIQQREITIMVY